MNETRAKIKSAKSGRAPRALIALTQLLIGVSLKTGFVGRRANTFFKALLLAFCNICATISLAAITAQLIRALVNERI